jgi:peptide/nickel transport system permease protein
MGATITEDPSSAADERQIYAVSQWKLVWWRFKKHRVAVASGVVLILFYLVALFPGFLSTQDPLPTDEFKPLLSPQRVHFFDDDFRFNPFVYGVKGSRNPVTLAKEYELDKSTKYRIRLFVRGSSYKFLGRFRTNWHLFGPYTEDLDKSVPLHILGTDRLGRDMYSRLIYGTRISLSIGLVGVALSIFLGILLGGVSGLYGGWVDVLIQRLIEFLRSIPTIPLWMGLGAALPRGWSVVQVYFAITVILSLIGWTTLARVVRGRFLSLREEDFVMAAQLYACSQMRIIFRHMVPAFASHIIAATTLAIPAIILAETSLSFLGVGMRPPAISWGVLLQGAQNLQAVASAPWLLIPGVFVVVVVLAFNFLGDGIRDAADPYQA